MPYLLPFWPSYLTFFSNGWKRPSCGPLLQPLLVMVLGLGSYLCTKSSSETEERKSGHRWKVGPEPEILANMYKIFIEKNTDMTVTVKPNFGKTTFLYEALKKGISLSIQSLQGPLPKVSSNQHHKSVMIQKQSTKLPEMGSNDKTTWPCSNLWLIKIPMLLQSLKGLPKSMDSRLFQISRRWKDNSKQVSRSSLTTERTETKACRSDLWTKLTSLHHGASPSLPGNPVWGYSNNGCLLQQMPKLLNYDLVVLEDDKQLFPPYQGRPS